MTRIIVLIENIVENLIKIKIIAHLISETNVFLVDFK